MRNWLVTEWRWLCHKYELDVKLGVIVIVVGAALVFLSVRALWGLIAQWLGT